jgi:hypothetical protein
MAWSYDDFEWGSNGDSISPSYGGITWTITTGVAKIATAQAYGGTRSMSLVNNAATNDISFPVTAGTDYSLICRMLMVSSPSILSNIVMHGNGSYYIQIYWDTDGQLYYYDTAAHSMGTFSKDAWHLLEVTNLNWTSHTFDVYVDEVLVKSGSVMRSGASYNNIWRWQQNANTGTKLFFDNIIVGKYKSIDIYKLSVWKALVSGKLMKSGVWKDIAYMQVLKSGAWKDIA